MNINGSPDISVLAILATFDLSGPLPVVNIVNQSQGPNLAGVTYWFVLTSPSGTPIHQGSLANPDANGVWENLSLTDSWPRPFGQIEWSGAPYNLTVFIQDSLGNQFTDASYNATICRPNGNTPTSRNYFGVAGTEMKVMCDKARIFFQDITNTSYKGLPGTQISSTLRLVYPIDSTDTIPPPMVINNFSTAAAPISYSSKNYQFQANSVYDYQLNLGVIVRVKYQTLDLKEKLPYVTFSVYCNIDLMPLICEFRKLVDSIESGSCGNVEDAQRRLTLINPLMSMAIIGIQQPLTGVDVPELINRIQEIGGFACDCCNAPTGIIPQTGSVIDGYVFDVVSDCGDIDGSVEVQGTNVYIHLSDVTYIFNISNTIPTTAFSISPSVNGCTKTYSLYVDLLVLSTDILNTIKTNVGLVNLFNSISGSSQNFMLSVDGKCIYQSTSAFNYAFTLSNVPPNSTSALLTNITVGGVVLNLHFALNLTNLSQLQEYLNALGIGAFTVTNPSGGTVLISSSNNPNQISVLQYSISGTTFIADQTSNASGYVPVSANVVVQEIINYLCGINDSEIDTSQDYTITYIGSDGNVHSVVVNKGSTLSALIQTILNLQGETVDNVGASVGVTCDNIKNAFPVSNKGITATDFAIGTKNGDCARLDFMDLFAYMLTTGINNATVKEAFCNFVVACGAGKSCAPYDYFDVIVTNYDAACAPIVGIEYSLS